MENFFSNNVSRIAKKMNGHCQGLRIFLNDPTEIRRIISHQIGIPWSKFVHLYIPKEIINTIVDEQTNKTLGDELYENNYKLIDLANSFDFDYLDVFDKAWIGINHEKHFNFDKKAIFISSKSIYNNLTSIFSRNPKPNIIIKENGSDQVFEEFISLVNLKNDLFIIEKSNLNYHILEDLVLNNINPNDYNLISFPTTNFESESAMYPGEENLAVIEDYLSYLSFNTVFDDLKQNAVLMIGGFECGCEYYSRLLLKQIAKANNDNSSSDSLNFLKIEQYNKKIAHKVLAKIKNDNRCMLGTSYIFRNFFDPHFNPVIKETKISHHEEKNDLSLDFASIINDSTNYGDDKSFIEYTDSYKTFLTETCKSLSKRGCYIIFTTQYSSIDNLKLNLGIHLKNHNIQEEGINCVLNLIDSVFKKRFWSIENSFDFINYSTLLGSLLKNYYEKISNPKPIQWQKFLYDDRLHNITDNGMLSHELYKLDNKIFKYCMLNADKAKCFRPALWVRQLRNLLENCHAWDNETKLVDEANKMLVGANKAFDNLNIKHKSGRS